MADTLLEMFRSRRFPNGCAVVMHAWTYEEDADLPPKLAYIEIYLLEHTTLLQ